MCIFLKFQSVRFGDSSLLLEVLQINPQIREEFWDSTLALHVIKYLVPQIFDFLSQVLLLNLVFRGKADHSSHQAYKSVK